MITRELSRMDQPTCTVCAHALAKTNEVAFVRLMMRMLLALLKVDVVFTHCAHSARATDKHPHAALTSTRKQRVNRRRSPQSALLAPPQWILGQPAFARRAAGKPRLPGLQVLQHRWLFEAWK